MDAKQVAFIVQNAVKVAHTTYKAVSGGWFLGAAPESFLQVELARHLAGEYFVTLEVPIPKLFALYETPIPSGLPRESGRLDLVCWNRQDGNQAEILIEVKRSWGNIEIKEDVKRMEQIIKAIKSIKLGLAVNLTSDMKKGLVESRLGEMLKNINNNGGVKTLYADYFSDSWGDEVWHMGTGCYVIDPLHGDA